jgi:tetratricopeptide (TPR) repeat protein
MNTRHELTARRVKAPLCCLAALLVLVPAASCRPDDQRTDTLDAQQGMQSREDMPPAAVAQLDSGTAAYRADDLEGALRHYMRVTEIAPDIGAGWFGVYMAEDALGHAERAAEAMERARSLVPGATLLHDGDAPR